MPPASSSECDVSWRYISTHFIIKSWHPQKLNVIFIKSFLLHQQRGYLYEIYSFLCTITKLWYRETQRNRAAVQVEKCRHVADFRTTPQLTQRLHLSVNSACRQMIVFCVPLWRSAFSYYRNTQVSAEVWAKSASVFSLVTCIAINNYSKCYIEMRTVTCQKSTIFPPGFDCWFWRR